MESCSLRYFCVELCKAITFYWEFSDLRIRLGLQGSSHLIFTVVVTKVVVKATVSDFKRDPSILSAGFLITIDNLKINKNAIVITLISAATIWSVLCS